MVVLRAGMCPGLDEDLVRDLRAADIKTVEDLVSCNLEELAQRCSVSYKALFAVRRVLLAQHSAFPVSGADLYEELLSSTAILSTGNPSLDKLLDSGLYTGEITELSGGPGSGKSQVCFGVAVHISQQLKQNVIYVDTTGGLTACRLLQMLQTETRSTEEQMAALQRIRVFRVFDVFSLLDCLYGLCSDGLRQASVGGGSVKAVIVDSVSAVISPLLGGKHNEGMSLMSQVAGVLRTMAKDFNVAALVTNHVTRSSSGELQPGLGVSWSHIPRTRILLERLEEETTTAAAASAAAGAAASAAAGAAASAAAGAASAAAGAASAAAGAAAAAAAASAAASAAAGAPAAASRSSLRSATLIKSSRQPCHIREEFDLQWWSRSKEQKTSGKRKREEESDS